ncbi:hypothetical protein AK830_g5285 [Neonectria ditissima]|uniref:Uncharacterized protein n=1 Tax=Neonectria ditissima TaxID=78410 RepID=A0A0P7BL40_9HYPO|nr:hypothetical protein AK830_g5285 [Neonectria ditissima]
MAMEGGDTGGFSATVYNLVGVWVSKKKADARNVTDGKLGTIPDETAWKLSEHAAMVHLFNFDGSGPLVVTDMSSSILSRRIPVKNFSVIFFGTQKDLGTSDITSVNINKSLLAPKPTYLDAGLLQKPNLPIFPTTL